MEQMPLKVAAPALADSVPLLVKVPPLTVKLTAVESDLPEFMSTSLNVVVDEPLRVEVPSNITLRLLCVKVPLLTKSPFAVRLLPEVVLSAKVDEIVSVLLTVIAPAAVLMPEPESVSAPKVVALTPWSPPPE